MFKVLLIVYVIGGGNSITYTSGFEFQEFHSMADCETVQKEMKKIKGVATYKDDSVIPLFYDTKCVPMTAVEVEHKSTAYSIRPEPVEPEPDPPTTKRKHSRWDD